MMGRDDRRMRRGMPAGIASTSTCSGPLRVVVDGAEVPIATRRQRALLVLLLMNVGRVVPAERLIDQLWDGDPPPQGAVTLRSYVSNLRQALGGQAGLGSALSPAARATASTYRPKRRRGPADRRLAEQGREHLRQRPARRRRWRRSTRPSGRGAATRSPRSPTTRPCRAPITQLTETYLGRSRAGSRRCSRSAATLDALPGLEAFTADHPLREEPRRC